MHTTNLRQVGGSVMLAIPPAILNMLDLTVGAQVGIRINDGFLVVEPKLNPRYSLDELLAKCDISAHMTEEDREWFEAKPSGKELL